MAGINRSSLFVVGYALFVSILSLGFVLDGLYVTDEGIYALMVDAYAKGGVFHIDEIGKGLDQAEFVEMVDVVGDRVVPQYPKLYPLIASPAYLIFGLYGLIFLNTASYAATIVVIYLLAALILKDERSALVAAAVYPVGTYSFRFAIDVWPHSLTVFLTTLAAYLALRGMRDGRGGFVLLAGFISGVAVGVRIPAAIYALVLMALILGQGKRMTFAAYFMAGLGIPISVIFYINSLVYGDFLALGYGGLSQFFGCYKYFGFFIWSLAVIYPPYFFGVKRWKAMFLFAIIIGLFLAATGWGGFWESVRVLFAEFVDMDFARDYVPKPRLSLLQGAPLMILFALGLYRLRGLRDAFFPLFYLTMTEVFFLTAMAFSHGGNTFYMRYLLGVLPFSTIAASHVISGKLPDIKERDFYFAAVSATFLFAAGIMADFSFFTGLLPMALAVLVFCSAFSRRDVFAVVFFCTVAYTIFLSVYAISDAMMVRQATKSVAGDFRSVPDGTVILSKQDFFTSSFLMLAKTGKNLTILDVGSCGAECISRLSGDYAKDRPVYLVSGIGENRWFGASNDSDWDSVIEETGKRHVLERQPGEYAVFYRLAGRKS